MEVVGPLDEQEQRRAVDAALAHLGLQRPMVYGVELRIDKDRGRVPRRRIGVLLAELDGYLAYDVVVSDGAEVLSADARPDLVPPFTDDEVAQAAFVARTDARVDEVARVWGVSVGSFYPSQHRHDDGRRRLVGLHYFDVRGDANVVPLISVVVDLTGRDIVSIESH
jgi:hypothetical protein